MIPLLPLLMIHNSSNNIHRSSYILLLAITITTAAFIPLFNHHCIFRHLSAITTDITISYPLLTHLPPFSYSIMNKFAPPHMSPPYRSFHMVPIFPYGINHHHCIVFLPLLLFLPFYYFSLTSTIPSCCCIMSPLSEIYYFI